MVLIIGCFSSIYSIQHPVQFELAVGLLINSQRNKFLKMLAHNNIIQKVSNMKNKKQRKRNQENPISIHLNRTQVLSPLKIKFDLRKDSMACFIGQKKSLKKRVTKGSASLRKTKNSLPKTQNPLEKAKTQKQAATRPTQTQSQQIVQGSLNSILTEIQAKGILCAWSEGQEGNLMLFDQNVQNQTNQLWRVFSGNQSFQKSYASTIDVSPNVNYYIDENYNYQPYNYSYNYKSFEEGSLYLVRSQEILCDPRTTVMIRNIPNKYTIKDLSEEIDRHLSNTYDFLYLPCDIKNQCNVGYGFINFISTQYLAEFYQLFQGKKWAKFRSQKICNLTYARLQGLDNLIDHFQNSKVLNQKDKKYRPIIREFNKIQNLIRSQQLS